MLIQYFGGCLRGGIIVGLGVMCLESVFSAPSPPASLEIGQPVPAVVLRAADGKYVFLGDLCYSGPAKVQKPRSTVVLNFMGVDCAPCKRELPQFLAQVNATTGGMVRAFLINTDPLSRRTDLDLLIKEYSVTCEVLLDPYKVAMKKFKLQAIPRTLVIAADGRLVGSIEGAVEDYADRLAELLRQANGVGLGTE